MVRTWGTVAPEGLHVSLAVDDPARYAAAAFVQALKNRGITVKSGPMPRHRVDSDAEPFLAERGDPLVLGPRSWENLATVAAPLEGRRVLASRVSVPVAEDITVINKVSQNLHAELLLRLLGKTYGSEGSFAQGARVVRQFLIEAGIEDGDFVFFDGSGMSSDDRMTPRALTRLLTYAGKQPWGAAWRATLPVAGVDGTLAGRFTDSPLKNRLWAKTGTHDEVNALSGYLATSTGRTLAFSILANGVRPGSQAGVRAIDRIVEAIAAAE